MANPQLRDMTKDTEVVDNSDYLDTYPEQQTDSLVSYVREIWNVNRDAKQIIEQEMLASQARIKGIYPADKLAALKKAGMPDVFLRLTYHKCRDTESWITEIHSSMGIDRTWDIEPDGAITLPPELAAQIEQQVRYSLANKAVSEAEMTGAPVDANALEEQAKQLEEAIKKEVIQRAKSVAEERSTNMEVKILSQLETGGWEKAFRACISDLARYKSCIMKGPIYRKKLVAVRFDEAGIPVIEPEIVAEFERVNPFNWYPAPNSIDVDDGPAIELEPFQRKDFTKLLGVPGYKEDAIREILAKYGTSGFSESVPIKSERDYIETNATTTPVSDKVGKIDSLNYWGEVPGKMLLEWGMTAEQIPDPDIDYQVNVKIVDNICYKAMLNPDLMGKKPYGVTSFVKNNDSQWGEAPADLMEDIQNGANQSARALEFNIAMSSAPIIQVNVDMLADGEDSAIFPGKQYETISKNLTTPAIRVDSIPMHVDELMRVMDFWTRKADDIVVPSFSANGATGADRTASGRNMRISAAARNIKLAVENVDQDIIIRAITTLFNNNMRYINDPSIKGALKVKARGTAGQMREEEETQAMAAMKQYLTPEDRAIMGKKGQTELLHATFKRNKLDADRLIPDYEEIIRGGNEPSQPPVNPTEQANIEADTAKKQAETAKIKSATILDLANAEAAEAGQQLEQYQAFTDRLAIGQQATT